MRVQRVNRWRIVLLVVCSAVSVAGCTKKNEAPVQNTAPSKPSPSAGKPVQQPMTSSALKKNVTTFDFATKKDPFKPYAPEPVVEKKQVSVDKVVPVRDLLPIQSFDVNKFKVSGIIIGLKENSALVIDPTGKGYVVRQGMKMGNNDGVITKIGTNYIEVAEQYREENGRIKKRMVQLTLPPKR